MYYFENDNVKVPITFYRTHAVCNGHVFLLWDDAEELAWLCMEACGEEYGFLVVYDRPCCQGPVYRKEICEVALCV